MGLYTVLFHHSAHKDLAVLPAIVVKRIMQKIKNLASNPRPNGCLKLKGEINLYRIRDGDYRVVYTIIDKEMTVKIVGVKHRKDAYE